MTAGSGERLLERSPNREFEGSFADRLLRRKLCTGSRRRIAGPGQARIGGNIDNVAKTDSQG